MGVQPTFPPRLMQATAAAHYLGVSVSTFRKLGIQPRECGALRLYDRMDLDLYADSLPVKGEAGKWDALFEGGSD